MINDFCFSDQSYGGWKWDCDYEGKVYDVRKFNDFDFISRIYWIRLTHTNLCVEISEKSNSKSKGKPISFAHIWNVSICIES